MPSVRNINLKSLLVWFIGATLTCVVFVGLVALPLKTWNSQSERKEAAQVEMKELESDIQLLTRELELLQSDAEITRRARQDFGLVQPGQESYRIVEVNGDSQ